MIQAYKDGNYFDFREYRKSEEYVNPDDCTDTHYFGGKGSKKLIRVYRHKNKSLRLETQFRGNYATVAFSTIANLEREDETSKEWSKITQKIIGGIAIGAIDFRDKSKLKNRKKASKDKTKRLPFWQDFIEQNGAVHQIKMQSVNPDFTNYQASFNWLEKCASKIIAKAFYLLREDKFISYVYKLVNLGESKFTNQDRKQIEYLRDNLEYLDLD